MFATALLGMGTGCAKPAPSELARVVELLHRREYVETLAQLDAVRDLTLPEACRARDFRIVALAGLRRHAEALDVARRSIDQCGPLRADIAARAVVAHVEAGGAVEEIEALLDLAPAIPQRAEFVGNLRVVASQSAWEDWEAGARTCPWCVQPECSGPIDHFGIWCDPDSF